MDCNDEFIYFNIWTSCAVNTTLNLLFLHLKHKIDLSNNSWQHKNLNEAVISCWRFCESVVAVFEIHTKLKLNFKKIIISSPVVGNSGNADDNGIETAVGNNCDRKRLQLMIQHKFKTQNPEKEIKNISIILKFTNFTPKHTFNSFFSLKVLHIHCLSCLDSATALFLAWNTGFVEPAWRE